MADATAPTAPRRSRVPQWLYEGVDLVQQRRRALLITFGLLVVIAAVVAYVAPDVLPPTVLVGAAIGVAALLLSLALLIALDTADIRLRGPRHVRAAGGELVAVLPSEPSAEGAVDLARAIEEARPLGRTLLLGIAAATGDGKRVGRWAQVVARTLADRDISVLSLDLTADGSNRPGFLEVVRHGYKLGEVVDLDPQVRLATLGPGRDATESLRAFNEAGRWIPRDLEVLIVALPMAASRAVVRASLSLDQLLIVAERDRTSRVELIAGLDATEAVGTHSQVILIDDTYARYLGIGAEGAEVPTDEDTVPEPQPDPMPGPVPDPVPDPQPDPLPDPMPDPAPQPEPTPQPDPLPDPDPEPGPIPQPEPEPEPSPQPDPTAAVDVGAGSEGDDRGDDEVARDDDRDEDAGPRDLDVMLGAAAATALADIAAHDDSPGEVAAQSADAGESEDEADGPGQDSGSPGPGGDRDELTVRVHRPAAIEDETTLEVERPDDEPEEPGADVGDSDGEPEAWVADVEDPDEPSSADEPPRRPPEFDHLHGSRDHELRSDEPGSVDPVEVGDVSSSPQVGHEEDVDEQELLNNTARLSLLMDQVSERGSDVSRGGA